MISEVYNMDCMEYMKTIPDKYFELAIVDPPYGIGFGTFNRTNKNSIGERFKANKYKNGEWDNNTPPHSYFIELFRVSKNQCIWGGNYFELPPTRGCCIWDKKQSVSNFSAFEFCWTSFDCVAKKYTEQATLTMETKIHPTQKSVKLYKWLLQNYAKQGDKILDTHLGSGSSRIAAYDMGFDFYSCELDRDYFLAQEKRFADHIKQQKLFTPQEISHPKQQQFFNDKQ